MNSSLKHIDKDINQVVERRIKEKSLLYSLTVHKDFNLDQPNEMNNMFGAKIAKSKFIDKSDREIWDAFRNSDELAFIFIYSNYYSKLLNYGWQFTRDKDLIEDSIQDLFIYLRSKRSQLGNLNSNIKVYLMFSFRRLILNYKRKIEKSQGLKEKSNLMFEIEESIENKILHKESSRIQHLKLNRAISKLSNKQREVIYYLYYQNLSYTEIKEIMQVASEKVIRNTLYKSLASLRVMLSRIVLFFFFLQVL